MSTKSALAVAAAEKDDGLDEGEQAHPFSPQRQR
jgi:hypothetical protein